jgi:hypothetical protein
MKQFFTCLAVLAALYQQTVFAQDPCPPPGYSKPDLVELRQSGFHLEDDNTRNALAVALLACVGNPDPELRDGVAFEGLANWLRAKSLSTETIESLYHRLLEQITDKNDEQGFLQPFSALILSEVARTDRVEESFSPERRAELVAVATAYLEAVRDYRGFSDTGGWRHGVAHGSDLVLQLVLNQNIDAGQISKLIAAVASQVSPPGDHFYTYGEPARLVRPIYYAYQRELLDQSDWSEWFTTISNPAPLESWNDAYKSNAGLARRHNTLAFLMAMYLNASALEGEQGEALSAMVMEALERIW